MTAAEAFEIVNRLHGGNLAPMGTAVREMMKVVQLMDADHSRLLTAVEAAASVGDSDREAELKARGGVKP